ncbi:hypothetical protein ACF0H2_09340 [Serratia marcescens]
MQHQRYRDKRQLSLLALGVAVALLVSPLRRRPMDMAVRVVSAIELNCLFGNWFAARAGGDAGRRRLAVAGAVMQALFENPLAEPVCWA